MVGKLSNLKWLSIAIVSFAIISSCSVRSPAVDEQIALLAPRLYVFDCGLITLEDVSMFGLSNEQTPTRKMFVPCYVIANRNQLFLWDSGLPVEAAGKGVVEVIPGIIMEYPISLEQQMSDLGWQVSDIDLIAFSHLHFDHAGSANLFSQSTLLIQQPEYEGAFKSPENFVGQFDPKQYNNLFDSKKIILDGDHDVFGDGLVTIISAPGHTPGHQVLSVKLANYGEVLLSGDLFHFKETRTLKSTPTFNHDAGQTLRSMAMIEEYLLKNKATLWIGHDLETANTLDLAPKYYD